jgi:iron complex outermembrane receptor protein
MDLLLMYPSGWRQRTFLCRRPWSVIAGSLLVVVLLCSVGSASGLPADESITFLKSLSIEELLQTEVTSVSKKTEALRDAAAAVFVITQEDLRRTGARSIPEALRMVPGLQVAHIDGSKWAITSRGFNEWFSNKLLVLIDGRTVYTPLFSGVYWEVQDTMLEDVERIEVIRGPGATMWGANAVNGVINIITKNAAHTQGGLFVGGAGNIEQPLVAGRFGGKIGGDAYYRFYGKGFKRRGFVDEDGQDAHDAWQALRGGFRMDWDATPYNQIQLQGEGYSGESEMTLDLSGYLTPPYTRSEEKQMRFHGGHLLSAWTHTASEGSQFTLQAFYDRTYRDQIVIEEIRDTVDLELQHHWQVLKRHDLVWGLGYRWSRDQTDESYNMSFDPADRRVDLWNMFLQDDIALWAERLWLTLGTKFEHNDYTGWEVQPSARLRFKPTAETTLWGAVSRAVRSPSRADSDIMLNLNTVQDRSGNLTVMRVTGNDDFVSEELTAYELGLRWQPERHFSFDLTGFYNDYDHLRAVETGNPYMEMDPGPPHLVIPLLITNDMSGQTYGFEGLVTWQALSFWKLSAGYAWLEMDLNSDVESSEEEAGFSPRHQFQLRSYLDLPWHLQLDSELYAVDELPELDVPGYARVDLRLGWQPLSAWSLSLNAENLFDDHHREFATSRSGVRGTEVPRVVYGQVVYQF